MTSIACCINVYNDAKALRGLLETAAPYFDNIFAVHSGPGGKKSDDGTIELLEVFGATIVYDDMDKGFGHIRTRLIHECGCAWAFILDADERFFTSLPVMYCHGTDRYPGISEPKLNVVRGEELVSPGLYLKDLINNTKADAIRTIRRHWFDFAMRRPAENWEIVKDYQMRIVRNIDYIGYLPMLRMHERLVDLRTKEPPKFATASEVGGPFHDHFHLHFRREQPGHKEHNESNYARLERGEPMQVNGLLRKR